MKILVGMSGGLDSTYAVRKLLSEGHTVAGAVIKMHEYTELDEARESAAALGIPLHEIDASALFEQRVKENFVSEYKKGRTPNPCIVCNSEVKFRVLLDFARERGFDKIATGHYASLARIENGEDVRHALVRAGDAKKDQTYMLWRLSEDILSHLVLPLSDMTKDEVRRSAKDAGLLAADRAESQEICFIPDNDYGKFIENRSGKSPEGNFVDESGRVLGRHKGIIHYTVGQRKGLGISLGYRAFVKRIDPEKNEIVLGAEGAECRDLTVSGAVFSGISEPAPGERLRLSVKHRYQAPITEAEVIYLGEGRARVIPNAPLRSVTPGQSAVFYLGDMLAFGGFID